MNSASLTFDRRKLAMEAVRASIKARTEAGSDLVSPINVYDACEAHGVTVRFVDINMEGMYDRHPRPRIHISALRPLVRRNLTCAHELGHHVFGHGSTIDELNERVEVADHDDPLEFIANQFAYFIMMPTLGIRNSIANRSLDLASAKPSDLFAIACHFGVGQVTLLTHLRYGLGLLPKASFERLRKVSPKALRLEILGKETTEPLMVLDSHWTSPTLDLETGDYVVLPSEPRSVPTQLNHKGEVPYGSVYQAARVGIGRVEVPTLASGIFVRVAKRGLVNGRPVGYVGLAKYRHLEDNDGE